MPKPPSPPDNVKIFTGVTRADMPVQVMLDGAKRADLKNVMIIGEDADGELFFSSSARDGGWVLWWMEQAKHAMLEIGTPPASTCTQPSADPTCSSDSIAGAVPSSTLSARVLSFTTRKTDAVQDP